MRLLTCQAADLLSTSRLLLTALLLIRTAPDVHHTDVQLLCDTLISYSKKHGQLKASIQSMVELAMGWLEEIKQRDGTEKWLQLIDTLRSVTEGKVSGLTFIILVAPTLTPLGQ